MQLAAPMMIAWSALLVDVATVESHAPSPTVTIAMPRIARAATPHVVPRRLGARRLATVVAPIAS